MEHILQKVNHTQQGTWSLYVLIEHDNTLAGANKFTCNASIISTKVCIQVQYSNHYESCLHAYSALAGMSGKILSKQNNQYLALIVTFLH